jgi:predicted DNA-binding antitoxin AbrB/MazE fold protein
MKISRNDLAKRVVAKEGKKVQVNIAQIKEVQRCLFEVLSEYLDVEILDLMYKIRKGR